MSTDERGSIDGMAQQIAGNGLLDSGLFVGVSALRPETVGAADPPQTPPWMQGPGAPLSPYGSPAKHESTVTRTLIRSQPGTTGSGASRTPPEALEGMITPRGCTLSGTTAACRTSVRPSTAC